MRFIIFTMYESRFSFIHSFHEYRCVQTANGLASFYWDEKPTRLLSRSKTA